MRPITGIKILGIRLGVIALAAYWVALFVGTHLPSGFWASEIQVPAEVSDKSKHFLGYFGLAILCCYVSQSRSAGRMGVVKRFLGVGVILLVYAAIDELTQVFSPGRVPDFWDAVADAAGIATGIATYCLAKVVWVKTRGSWS